MPVMPKAGRQNGWKLEKKTVDERGSPHVSAFHPFSLPAFTGAGPLPPTGRQPLSLPTFVVVFADPPSTSDPAILAESVQLLTRVKHGRARFSIT
jgi:hypothetical protein